MIVPLASFPRSGSNFFVIVAYQTLGVKVSTVYEEPPATAAARLHGEADNRLGALRERILAGKASREECAAGPSCLLLKTHEVNTPDDVRPAVYLVRDGRDALVSFAHYALAVHPADTAGMTFADVLAAMVRSTGHFGGWSGNVHSWLDRAAPTAVVRYDDLVVRPEATVRGALQQLGLSPSPVAGDVPSFVDMRALWPDIFRRGRTGAWREEMPAAIEDLFWWHHGDAMERLGYRR